jgi:hypothetical protein
MPLETLDPELTLALLEGHDDMVGPAAAEQEAFYASQTCPHCHGESLQKVAESSIMFSGGSILPKFLLKCACGCTFSPHSGLIVTLGNLAEVLEPAVPLINGDDD